MKCRNPSCHCNTTRPRGTLDAIRDVALAEGAGIQYTVRDALMWTAPSWSFPHHVWNFSPENGVQLTNVEIRESPANPSAGRDANDD